MKRIVVFVAVALMTMSLSDAAPDRKPHAPELPKRPVPLELRGSTWTGFNSGVGADWVVVFEPNGNLVYTYRGTTYRNGTWTLEGNALYYQVNQKYCEFQGTVSGDKISGESWNQAGKRWPIQLQRSK
jgi:hypothetical protein